MLYNGWILLIVFDVHDVMKSQKIRWNHVLRAPARPLQKRHRRFALYGNPIWPRGGHLKKLVEWQMRDQILQKVNLALLIAGTKFTKVKAFPDWDPESPQPQQRFIKRQCFRNVAGRFLRGASFVRGLAWNSQSTGCAWSEPLKPQCILRRSQVNHETKIEFETKSSHMDYMTVMSHVWKLVKECKKPVIRSFVQTKL